MTEAFSPLVCEGTLSCVPTLALLLGCQSSIQCSALLISEEWLGAQAVHSTRGAPQIAASLSRHVLTELTGLQLALPDLAEALHGIARVTSEFLPYAKLLTLRVTQGRTATSTCSCLLLADVPSTRLERCIRKGLRLFVLLVPVSCDTRLTGWEMTRLKTPARHRANEVSRRQLNIQGRSQVRVPPHECAEKVLGCLEASWALNYHQASRIRKADPRV